MGGAMQLRPARMVASTTVPAVFPGTRDLFGRGRVTTTYLDFRGRLCERRTVGGVRRGRSYESSCAQSTDFLCARHFYRKRCSGGAFLPNDSSGLKSAG